MEKASRNFKQKNPLEKIYQPVDETSIQRLNFGFKSVGTLFAFIVIFILFYLFKFQIIEGRENLLAATKTSQSYEITIPPRGIIYSSDGEKLAFNVPVYKPIVHKDLLSVDQEREILAELAFILDIDETTLLNNYRELAYDSEEDKIKLDVEISNDKYLDVIKKIESIEQVSLIQDISRRYKDPVKYSHILGYTGKPTKEELTDEVLTVSTIGKIGVEKEYDNYLRGGIGKKVFQTDLLTDLEDEFEEDYKYGENLYLTIDSQWQEALMNAMEAQVEETEAFAATGVIINSNTGEVKSLVNYPSYDNNAFSRGISSQEYSQLLDDPKTPLLNRAIALQLPSGSIFKVVAAATALEEGIIEENTLLSSESCFQLSENIQFCEADLTYLGNLKVTEALSKSSNIFFCKVALKLSNEREGIYTLSDYASQFGLGNKTGIDLPGEQKGTFPLPELKKEINGEPWYPGDDCNTVIGQGLLTVTPMQMAVVVSAISNGGRIIEPRVLNSVVDQNSQLVYSSKQVAEKRINVSTENLEIVKSGMKLAAESGSAAQLNGLPGNIIAKTGSADAAEYINGELYQGAHSWVMGCFDYEGENYCFVVMQQWGGRGYKTVPIVKNFLECLNSEFSADCRES